MFDSTVALDIAVVFFLIFLCGILSLTEAGLLGSKKTKIQQFMLIGRNGASEALDFLENPARFLIPTQIGITTICIILGGFSFAKFSPELITWLLNLGLSDAYAGASAFFIVASVVSMLAVFFGELAPKRLALNSPETVAIALSPTLNFLNKLILPLISFFGFSINGFLKLLGVSANEESHVTEEEVREIIEQGTEAGVFDKEEESIMKRVLGFGDRRAADLMTPRTQLVALDIDAPFDESLAEAMKSPHTYFPVFEGTIDNIIGVISVKSLLQPVVETGVKILRAKMSEPLFVPESMTTVKILEVFKRSGKHHALVYDEYGGVAGFVTAIDVLESMVGDLPAEYEVSEERVTQRSDGSWLIDGVLPVGELQEVIGAPNLFDGEYLDFDTLGGMVMYYVKAIPKVGDKFERRGFMFEVVDMDGRRVDKVMVRGTDA